MDNRDFIELLKDKCNINLTEQQEKAVLRGEGNTAVIAVPGSGKTLTLISRTAYLILCEGIRPDRILAVTFSRAAARDMQHRFENKFRSMIETPVRFSTIHSFAYNVIINYSRYSGTKYVFIENKDAKINKNYLLSGLYKKYNNEPINEDKLVELGSFIGFLKNNMINTEKLDVHDEQFPVPHFKDIYREYESIKLNNNYMDYDDMLCKCYNILCENKSIYEYYRDRYDYVEVDESQDTSRIQFAIIDLLTRNRNNLYIVGDDDQCIYSWRGSDPSYLLNFKKKYGIKSSIIFMEQNFRSTGSIVKLANNFIKSNLHRYNKNLKTNNEKGVLPEIIKTSDEAGQVYFIIDKLKQESNFGSSAVLFRNNISSIILADAFIKEGVPFYIKDTVPAFFNHWITRDIISFFDLAMDRGNVEAFQNIYYKMKSFVRKDDVLDLSVEYGETVFKALYRKGYEKLKGRFLELDEKLNKLSKLAPLSAIDFICQELYYMEYVKGRAEKLNYSMDNIDTMLSNLKLISEGVTNISDFCPKLESLERNMEHSKVNRNKDVVTLSTMHSSKGLEFDNVYIIDLIDGIIPSCSSIKSLDEGNDDAIDEENRLMYVSMTRSKRKLYLIYPASRNGEDIVSSRFLKRIDNILFSMRPKPVVPPKAEKTYASGFKVHMIVEHKNFGKGEIINITGDNLKILFESGGTKLLSANVCNANHILKVTHW